MTGTMSDTQRGLIRAVCAQPHEDTPRMVLADWLEENGDPDHAEFIRDQVEWRPGMRDFDLLNDNWERWYPRVARHDEKGFTRPQHAAGITVPLFDGSTVVFSRGFVSEVTFSTVAKCMAAIENGYWGEQPVTAVKVVGAEPSEQSYRTATGKLSPAPIWRWFDQGDGPAALYLLPDPLWKAFHDHDQWPSLVRRGKGWEFATRADALRALSDGVVALGRQRAGLPQLTEAVA